MRNPMHVLTVPVMGHMANTEYVRFTAINKKHISFRSHFGSSTGSTDWQQVRSCSGVARRLSVQGPCIMFGPTSWKPKEHESSGSNNVQYWKLVSFSCNSWNSVWSHSHGNAQHNSSSALGGAIRAPLRPEVLLVWGHYHGGGSRNCSTNCS